MNTQVIRIELIRRKWKFKDLARITDIDYDRLMKILNAFRDARPEEVRKIAVALNVQESRLLEGGK